MTRLHHPYHFVSYFFVFLQFGHHKANETKGHEPVDLAPDLLLFTVLAAEPEVKLVLDEALKSLEKQLQHKPEDVELRANLVVKVTELEHAYRGICFDSLNSTCTQTLSAVIARRTTAPGRTKEWWKVVRSGNDAFRQVCHLCTHSHQLDPPDSLGLRECVGKYGGQY